MAYMEFAWWDYLICFSMFSVSLTIGIYYGVFGKKEQDLFTVDKMQIFPLALSFIASTISIPQLLSFPDEIYSHGTQYWVENLSLVVNGVFVYYIILPTMYRFKAKNFYDYLELRFDRKVRKTMSTIFILSTFLFLPVFIYAPALAFNQVTGIRIEYVAPFIAVVCIIYTAVGGLKAVVWSDTIQFSITFCCLLIASFVGLLSVGGFSKVWDIASAGGRIEFFNMDFNPTVRSTFWSVFLGNIFVHCGFLVGQPASMQRLLSVPTLAESRRILLVFIVGLIATKTIVCFLGLIIYARYSQCDPLTSGSISRNDQIVPYFVMDMAQEFPLLSTVFVAALLSVGLSVLSTLLNVTAALIYVDFVSPFWTCTKIKDEGLALKILVVLLGIISLALVFVVEKMGPLFELLFALVGGPAGVIVGMMILGAFYPKANPKGVMYGAIVSLLFVSWVTVNNTMHVSRGPTKALSIAGCYPNATSATNFTYTTNGTSERANMTFTDVTAITEKDSSVFWLFRISFYYYVMMGGIITTVVGMIVSHFSASSKATLLELDLTGSICIKPLAEDQVKLNLP